MEQTTTKVMPVLITVDTIENGYILKISYELHGAYLKMIKYVESYSDLYKELNQFVSSMKDK